MPRETRTREVAQASSIWTQPWATWSELTADLLWVGGWTRDISTVPCSQNYPMSLVQFFFLGHTQLPHFNLTLQSRGLHTYLKKALQVWPEIVTDQHRSWCFTQSFPNLGMSPPISQTDNTAKLALLSTGTPTTLMMSHGLHNTLLAFLCRRFLWTLVLSTLITTHSFAGHGKIQRKQDVLLKTFIWELSSGSRDCCLWPFFWTY